jgi:hypothetical protein
VFHFVASLFTAEVRFRKSTPDGRIRELRASGLSVSKVAEATGTTPAVVRRLVGRVDKAITNQRRREQEETAKKIDAGGGTWAEKVAEWTAATGQTGVTFWRVLKRCRS